jgi:hypothetical protein
VQHDSKDVLVSWSGLPSQPEFIELLRTAAGLDMKSEFYVEDDEGDSVVLSASIPDDAFLKLVVKAEHVEARPAPAAPPRPAPADPSPDGAPSGSSADGELPEDSDAPDDGGIEVKKGCCVVM